MENQKANFIWEKNNKKAPSYFSLDTDTPPGLTSLCWQRPSQADAD